MKPKNISLICKTMHSKYLIYYVIGFIIIFDLIVGQYVIEHNRIGMISPDTHTYTEPAKQIIAYLKFNNENGPEVFRTPGYPLLLSIGYAFQLDEALYSMAINMILWVGVAYFTQLTVHKLTGDNLASKIILILSLIDPLLFIYQFKQVSEIFFTFAIVLLTYLITCNIKKPTSLGVLGCLLMATISAFIRPISIYLPYLISIVFIYCKYRNHTLISWKKLLLLIVLGSVLSQGAISVWKLRNFNAAESNEFASVSSYNMNSYIASAIIADSLNVPRHHYKIISDSEYYNQPQAERKAFALYKLKTAIIDHPFTAAKIFITGLVSSAIGPGEQEWSNVFAYDKERWTNMIRYILLAYTAGLWIPFFLIPIKGNCIGNNTISVYCIILYFLILSSHGDSYSRFRTPIEPLLLILLGCLIHIRKKCSVK